MPSVPDRYREILRRLDDVRKKENRLALVFGLFATAFLSFIVLLNVVLIERAFSPGNLGRMVLFFSSTALLSGSLIWLCGKPLLSMLGVLRPESRDSIAVRVGKHFPEVRDRLLDALQMVEHRERNKTAYSSDLIDAAFHEVCRQVEPLDFTEVVSNTRTKKTQKFTSLAGAVLLLVFIISPGNFLGSLTRVARYHQSYAALQPILFHLEPGHKEIVRGEHVTITVTTEGRPLSSLLLWTRREGQMEFERQILERNSNGNFRAEIPNLSQTTEYYAESEEIRSEKFILTVLNRPLIRSLQLTVTPPAYTRLPARSLDENTGDVTGYPGTTVSFDILSSKPLSSAQIKTGRGQILPLSADNQRAIGKLILKENKSYRIELQDTDGLTNSDPVEYFLKIVPDEYPAIEILYPGKNLDIGEDMSLPLSLRVNDDFGITKIRLAYRLIQSRYEPPHAEVSLIEVPFRPAVSNQADVQYRWDLSTLSLAPEDILAYYAEVYDNDNVSGPKFGRSEIYLLRLPSLEEVFADVGESHDRSLESMREASGEAGKLKKDIEELQREMKKNAAKTEWQQQQKAEQMLQRYDAIKKKLDESARAMDDMVKKMEENKILSNETLEKYAELQQLMQQLQNPELQEALKKLLQSAKQPTPEEMRKALDQMKFSEEQFRQSLERTIELLKRIHIEQKLEEVIKRTEELQRQQDQLQQQTSKSNPADQHQRDSLARRQDDLQKELASLEREVFDLRKRMEEFSKDMPLEEMSKAQESLEQQQLNENMTEASQQMQSGNFQKAQQQQQQTSQGLQQFAQQMKQVQQALQDKQMQQVVNEMKRQTQNLLELSRREEELKEEMKNIDPFSRKFRENAENQLNIMNDLSNIAQSLTELAKKTFAIGPELGREIGNALSQMGEAMRSMEGRNPGGVSQQQNQAMSSLNRAASMMQSMLGGMMQGGQGMGMSGLMGRLQQMMGMQSGVNDGTQQALGMGGNGQGMSAEQQAAYQRLAAQQGAVQKSLEQLANEAKTAGEFSKLLGDLDKIAREMKEVQTDLEQGDVNPITVQKQERILSRLLDSQRSMRERDYENKRRAESGKEYRTATPRDLDLSTQEGKNRLRREMLKALEGKYSKDYEDLIRKYFEQLEKEEIVQ